MQSLKELYRIGKGPSSSHTIGPERASQWFLSENLDAERFEVVLYGSLAKTGAGHGTQRIVETVFGDKATVVIDELETDLRHPNTMDFRAYYANGEVRSARVYSVGGGAIEVEGVDETESKKVYPLSSFSEIRAYCEENGLRISEYAYLCEGEQLRDYLTEVWQAMRSAIKSGLKTSGVLPGGLGIERKAKTLYKQNHIDESAETRENRVVCAYAFAVSEENAGGGTIVTAPTCGACGVLPAVLKYAQERRKFTDEEVIDALATAGIVGNLIKTNASISGAECGCQAEIGSACCMAAAALGELYGMDLSQIEYAAEIAMEHHLGLTCDPIAGLVQIPCIERNAVAAMRAINAARIANFLSDSRKISFDLVIQTMYETGKDISGRYRETSEGGLAKLYKKV